MANTDAARYWAEGARGWVENEATFDAVFAPVTRAVLDAAAPGPGMRVLDVGCGSGTLLAASAAAGADCVGVDISPGMVTAARRRVPQATVLVADAQTADLAAEAPGAPYDRVLSRFGVMFFDDPGAAFANLRSVASDGARLVFACWRGRDENPMFTLGSDVLVERMDPPPPPPEPTAPGPTAFADRDRLVRLLGDAGWADVAVDGFDWVADYGTADSDGVEERLRTVLSTGNGRLAREQLEARLGPAGWTDAVDDVRAELRRHRVDGVVRFPAATWLVTTRNRDVSGSA